MSPKRLKFIDEYLIDGNATQAAIRSGFSEKTAYSQGQRLLKNVEVAEKIAILQEQIRKENSITRDEVLGVLASIIRADVPNFLNNDGKLKDLDTLSGKERKAIESIKIGKKGVITLKLSSKLQAVNVINRMLGFEAPQNINLQLERLNDQDLETIIEKLSVKKD